jgi:ABC-type polysaccharide/polyol phosphate transport system ATPase subunit
VGGIGNVDTINEMDILKRNDNNPGQDAGPLLSADESRPADVVGTGGADISLSVRNITKVYKLYDSPRHRFNETFHPLRKKYHRDFYALKDVSFDVEKGQTIGIIGRNGSGKSTLLQIITGVLTPTSGSVATNGRISALLELGSGFNPEFTGIENVFLSGSLMGFGYDEIGNKLDSIIEFADVGEFINQPMKIYSSGMYVRLAFAVAINVDPDILIIDEAMAVGDAKFQRKCFARMDEIKERGCTIVLVSHDTTTIKSFTKKTLLLDNGNALFYGDSVEATVQYYRLLFPQEYKSNIETVDTSRPSVADLEEREYALSIETNTHRHTYGIGGAEISRVNVYGLEKPNIFHGNNMLEFEFLYRWDKEFVSGIIAENGYTNNLIVGAVIYNKKNIAIAGFNTYDMGYMIDPFADDNGKLTFSINMPVIASDDYFITIAIAVGTQENHVQLKWYENLIHLQCLSRKKYTFGVCHFDVTVS